MATELTFVFLDINSEFDEERDKKTKTHPKKYNISTLESPTLFLEIFIKNHVIVEFEKNTDDPSELIYNFKYQIIPGKTAICKLYILNNLTDTNKICLSADSYIIICSLEEVDTTKKLKKIINYIKHDCLPEIPTNIIGVYKNNIFHDLEYEKMKKFFNNKKLLYNYFELFCGNNKENIENKEEMKKEDINLILEKVFAKAFEESKIRENLHLKDENDYYSSKESGVDISHGCCIY